MMVPAFIWLAIWISDLCWIFVFQKTQQIIDTRTGVNLSMMMMMMMMMMIIIIIIIIMVYWRMTISSCTGTAAYLRTKQFCLTDLT